MKITEFNTLAKIVIEKISNCELDLIGFIAKDESLTEKKIALHRYLVNYPEIKKVLLLFEVPVESTMAALVQFASWQNEFVLSSRIMPFVGMLLDEFQYWMIDKESGERHWVLDKAHDKREITLNVIGLLTIPFSKCQADIHPNAEGIYLTMQGILANSHPEKREGSLDPCYQYLSKLYKES